ncbi:MAG TPA: DUF1302 family protein [Nevskiaceae bacterium]|nr:DUF1302 family protein [Nevskiaceae bacterium]
MKARAQGWVGLCGGTMLWLGMSQPVQALTFMGPWETEGVFNTTITLGAGWRMEKRADDLVGKGNLDPNACGGHYQSCQGLFRDQTFPAARLGAVPGQFSPNFDDGNWNYDKGDVFSGVVKVTQDLTLTHGDFGFFAKGLWFFDEVNNNFKETHNNIILPSNKDRVGLKNPLLNPTGPQPNGGVLTLNPVQYGPGAYERIRRENGELLEQVGTEVQLLDAYFFGKVALWGERDLTFKIGRQIVNWGESTLLVVNSVNQAQPVSAGNFGRIGFQVEEVYTPVAMAFASMEVFANATLEGYYQLEWQPVDAPAPGSFFYLSDLIGTDNAVNSAYLHFGGSAEDPYGIGYPQYNPLSGVTPTSLRVERLKDNDARTSGQYGVALKYYAENLNNGTELSFYYMKYHSKLPYVSFYATQASCARREGNAMGIDAYDSVSFVLTCPGLPVFAGSPENATSDAVPFDTSKLLVEYPEDIHMIGMSFNTTLDTPIADFSIQGEVAWRPDQPLQVDVEDLAFAAFGPTLSRCHDRDLPRALIPSDALNQGGAVLQQLVGSLNGLLTGLGVPLGVPTAVGPGFGCSGTTTGVGYSENGGLINYAPSDVDPQNPDTFDLLVGHAPGSARAFPSFVTAYRGMDVGENPGCTPQYLGARQNVATRTINPAFNGYHRNDPCYIKGWETFDTLNFVLGATHVAGATDTVNFIKADQIITLFEFGAMWIPDLPSLDELQIETPGTYRHASAGADGTGADGSQQACSKNPTCVVGGDGLRFNPQQQDLSMFVDKFSWGYDIIQQIRYESVLPGISVQPQLIWKHDVKGNSPGPGENFIKDRRTMLVTVETRYKSSLSLTVGYQWFFGAGEQNLYRDKDFAQMYVKYQF